MDPANGHKLLRKGICQRFCPTERGDQLEAAITDLQLSLELMEAAPVGRRTVDDVFTAKKQLGITYNELGMRTPPPFPSSRGCAYGQPDGASYVSVCAGAYDAGDYESAYNTFTKALEVERTRAYLVNRGDSLREQGLLVSHHLTSQLCCGHSCQLSFLSLSARAALRQDQCIADYAEAIEAKPMTGPDGEPVEEEEAPRDVRVRVAVAFNEVGMQLYQRHQYVEAFDYFSKSIVHLPDVLEYRLNRFHAADACGQLQTAVEDLRAAVRIDPDNTYVRSRLRDMQQTSTSVASR